MFDSQIDQEAQCLFEESLRRELGDEETRADIEKLAHAGLDISVEQVGEELLASPEQVLGGAKTMLDEWKAATARLAEVRADQFERVRRSLLRPSSGIGLTVAIGGFLLLSGPAHWIALSLLAIPVAIVYLAFFREAATLASRTKATFEARKRFLEMLDPQTRAAIRETINRRLTSFSTNFRIFDRRGLRQLSDPDREVPTTAVAELARLVESLDSGSIGLSGPRGCGKTTLIRSFTEGRTMPFSRELVGLIVGAPVKYDAREFVLHLFASLCERVLRNQPGDLARAGSRWSRSGPRTAMVRLGIATVASAALGAALVFEPRVSTEELGFGLLLLAYITGLVWLGMAIAPSGLLVMFIRRTRRSTSRGRIGGGKAQPEISASAEETAKDYLKQIRFQQSREVGQSMELTLPFGLGTIGGSSNTTLSRAPWTLPHAVEEFRRFASTLSDRYVVIGIDELDKMESDDAAREFLNNVKGVFGVTGCYFLVSVSEDAMSAFERRGLPVRDVFDSSFDEIQRVGFLDLEQSRVVLESRVTGLPVPFQCLCHCLAGGLPRDLIRVTRELVHSYDIEIERMREKGQEDSSSPVEIPLATLSERLIESEWRGKLAGASAAGLFADGTHPWWLTRWLHSQAQGKPESNSLQRWTLEIDASPGLAEPANEDGSLRKAQRIAAEMMVFNYYAATLLDLFGDERMGALLTSPTDPEELAPRQGWVEKLAAARQQFSVDPWLSWGVIEDVRHATGLTSWGPLRSAPDSRSRSWLFWRSPATNSYLSK